MSVWKSGFDSADGDINKGQNRGTGADLPPALPLGWRSAFDASLGDGPDRIASSAHFERPASIIGTPDQDSLSFGQQRYPDTCAIRCQEFVIEQFTGRPIDEDALVAEALAHGWYRPGEGTPDVAVGNLLELHGIPVRRYQAASIVHLAQELAAGHKVIIAVDGAELRSENPILEDIQDWLGFEQADHAIVVTGIDTRDPNDLHVIVNDPATGDAGRSYPLRQFLNAWQDSHFTLVATRDPVPSSAPEMRNFDYTRGFFDRVAAVMGFHVPSFHAGDEEAPIWPQTTIAGQPDSFLHLADGQTPDHGGDSENVADEHSWSDQDHF